MANRPKPKIAKPKADLMAEFSSAVNETARQAAPGKEYSESKGKVKEGDVWVTDSILTFSDFCKSTEHMNFPTLSPRQSEVAEHMFGDDPKKIFDNNRHTAVLVFGKGSGKDTLSALMQLYIVYVLLNMHNPQRFFGFNDGSSLDMLNIASNKEQAEQVYFQILKTFVTKWRWLRNKWDISINGRYFSSQADKDIDFLDKITLTNDAVLFPKNIRMFSGSSEAESMEGKNILCFVMDEADAFKQESLTRSADKIYRVLRSSAVSRFGNRYKGFIISYPRSKDGFIMRMYARAKSHISFYCDIAATWEVLPKEKYSDKTFEFQGIAIPMDLYEEFRLDPINAMATYACRPPESEASFFEDVNRIDESAKNDRPLFDFMDSVSDGYTRKQILSKPHMYDRSIKHVLCFDLSEVSDATALSLAHRAGDKIYVDFTTAWIPDKRRTIKVDLRNVETMIDEIRKLVTVSGVYGDFWGSAILVQSLRGRGVNAEITKIGLEDYQQFKRLLYSGHIVLPQNERLLRELKELQIISGRKVDHPTGKHNDLACTVIMACKMLLDPGPKEKSVNLMAEGVYVGENMHDATEAYDNMGSKSLDGIMIDGIEM